MQTLYKIVATDKAVFLSDLIAKDYYKQIVKYKTWDNRYCRGICLEIMKNLENKYFSRNSPINNLGEVAMNNNLIIKIFKDFKELKELCEFGCIHNELHNSINKILTYEQ